MCLSIAKETLYREAFPGGRHHGNQQEWPILEKQRAKIRAIARELRIDQRVNQLLTPQAPPTNHISDNVSAGGSKAVFTQQPVILTEAAPAMKWANKYDKEAVAAAYLSSISASPDSSKSTT